MYVIVNPLYVVTGYLVDTTQNYSLPYFIYGTLAVLGGVIMLTLPLTQKCVGKKKETEELESTTDNPKDVKNKSLAKLQAASRRSLNVSTHSLNAISAV